MLVPGALAVAESVGVLGGPPPTSVPLVLGAFELPAFLELMEKGPCARTDA